MTNPYGQQLASQGYGQQAAPQAPAPQAAPAPNQFEQAAPQDPAANPYGQPQAAPAPQAQAPAPQAAPAPAPQPQAPQATPQPQAAQPQAPQAAPAGAPVNLAETFGGGTSTGGDKLFTDENLGRPVAVRPLSVESVTTQYGTSNPVRAQWIFLDTYQPGQAPEIHKGLIFATAVSQSLNDDILMHPVKQYSISTVGKAATASQGHSKAWLLNDAPEWIQTASQAITEAGMY